MSQTLSQEVIDITAELVDTYPQIDLLTPLMLDFEYWFQNSCDTDIQDQIENVAQRIILPYKGRIHPFVPFVLPLSCPSCFFAFLSWFRVLDENLATGPSSRTADKCNTSAP